MPNWYAIFVISGKENKVKERLMFRFGDTLKVVVPKRRLKERRAGVWVHRTRVLFPGYVLVYGDIGIEEYHMMKNIPDMIKLLSSESTPLIIEDYEMQYIAKLIGDSDIIGYSDIFYENGIVVVSDGPLISMEGQIVKIDRRKGRAKVRINFMGEERIVELGINVLSAV